MHGLMCDKSRVRINVWLRYLGVWEVRGIR
jgi:hypothetical protein